MADRAIDELLADRVPEGAPRLALDWALGLALGLVLALALALAAVLAVAVARGPAPGLAFASALGFRPGRAGGVGMAVTVHVFNQDFSIAAGLAACGAPAPPPGCGVAGLQRGHKAFQGPTEVHTGIGLMSWILVTISVG